MRQGSGLLRITLYCIHSFAYLRAFRKSRYYLAWQSTRMQLRSSRRLRDVEALLRISVEATVDVQQVCGSGWWSWWGVTQHETYTLTRCVNCRCFKQKLCISKRLLLQLTLQLCQIAAMFCFATAICFSSSFAASCVARVLVDCDSFVCR